MRRTLTLAVAALLLSAACVPTESQLSQQTLPPEDQIFERPPSQFFSNTRANLVTMMPGPLHNFCGRGDDIPAGWRIFACTNRVTGTVYMPNPCLYSDGYAQLLCHELAHVNGWGHDEAWLEEESAPSISDIRTAPNVPR